MYDHEEAVALAGRINPGRADDVLVGAYVAAVEACDDEQAAFYAACILTDALRAAGFAASADADADVVYVVVDDDV